MDWDFTPTQVMKGEIEYSLSDFYRDLEKQVKTNFGKYLTEDKFKNCCNLFWLFCHYQAIMLSEEEIAQNLVGFEPPMSKELITMTCELCQDDSKMLAAIYQNLFLKYFSQALKESWGDEEKATSRTLALVNLYINRHVKQWLA
jgi:hypothetical protein